MLLGEKGIDKLYYKINGDKLIPQVMLNYQKLIAKHLESLLSHASINFIADEGHSLVNQGDEIREFLN